MKHRWKRNADKFCCDADSTVRQVTGPEAVCRVFGEKTDLLEDQTQKVASYQTGLIVYVDSY